MDKITQYQNIIQQLLQQYASIAHPDPEVETQFIFDTERHHYQLLHVGWRNERRIYGCFLHSPFKRQFTEYAVG